jgi:arsenite methyltransferase
LRPGGLEITVKGLEVCAWPDDYLDGLICECVLSLTDDQPLVLKEFYRVLKAGGKLLVSDISVVSLTADSSFQSNTCLQGATPPDRTLHRLSDAGFTVAVINEYPEALKQLTAQLLWQGSTDLKKWLGPFCASDKCATTYSYMQWIGGKSSWAVSS